MSTFEDADPIITRALIAHIYAEVLARRIAALSPEAAERRPGHNAQPADPAARSRTTRGNVVKMWGR